MGIKALFLVFSLLFFTPRVVWAGEGCVINNMVHQYRAPTSLSLNVLGGNKVFSEVSMNANACNLAPKGQCSACLSGGTVVSINVAGLPVILCNRGGLLGNYAPSSGTYYADYIIQCDLDHYSWTMGLLAVSIGFFAIKRMD